MILPPKDDHKCDQSKKISEAMKADKIIKPKALKYLLT